jgi:signal transduction histidine kinase
MGRYLIAIVAVAASGLLRLLLTPLLNNEAPMLAFVVGVAVAAILGGFGPGLLATGLSILVGEWFFIEPRYSLIPASTLEATRLGLFTFEGLVIAYAGGRVRRHTKELDAEVLRRTLELERSNEALETFAHTISHDIRAPLRSIRGFAEIIEEDYAAHLPADGRDYTGRIAAAAHRLESLVNNLLAYTRLGRREIAAEPVAIDRLLQQVVHDMAEEVRQAGGRIETHGAFGAVLAHRETLALILTNLISNALKFVPRGTPPLVQVTGSLTGTLQRISVRDNGIGLAAADRARVFQPFERLHSRDVYAGSGLGLALVARGVERIGGRYGVESNAGGGSEFWLELPLVAGGADSGSTDPAR